MVFKMTAWFAFSCLFQIIFHWKKRKHAKCETTVDRECFFHNHAHKKEHCYEVNSMGYVVNSDLFGLVNNDACKYSK